MAYVSDHQAPPGLSTVADSVLELCDGVDLLIHDSQYTPDEFQARSTWGHCTMDYALLVAREAGARRLALFHHDPNHSDAELDTLHAAVRGPAAGPVEVFGASEGMRIHL